jgi:uncharacterized membrane protein YcaP (DUF421 family)
MTPMINLDAVALGEIALRTFVVYLVIMIGLRLAGKRELGQMTVLELVLILLIANGVQNAMVGPDTSLSGGLVAAVTLLVSNVGMRWFAARMEWFQLAVRGVPTVLVSDGQVISDHLRSESLLVEDLMMAIREHGFEHLEDVKIAVLEVDGTISIVPRSAPHFRTRRRVSRVRQ